jgi:hypothetical protein
MGFELLEPRELLASIPFGAAPEDICEYMLGDVYVSVVLLESDGTVDPNQEDWTPSLIQGVKQWITEGLRWWEDTLALKTSAHSLHFIIDFTRADNPVSTPYEPIARPTSDASLWIGSFLAAVGFDITGNLNRDMQAFNHAQRLQGSTHWGFILFIVNTTNDPDKRFADGSPNAWAARGGPYTAIQSHRDATTVAHEVGHIFYAADQVGAGTEDRSGYYNTENLNPGLVPNIMDTTTRYLAYANHTASPSSFAQIGWQDSDADGIFDVLDVPHQLFGSGFYDPIMNHYEFHGTSMVRTLPNQNSWRLGNDITINTISRTQYRLDGGSWIDAGDYGGYSETIDLVTGPLPPGRHDIEVRTISDESGVTSNVFRGNTDFPTSAPGEGINGFVWLDRDGDATWDGGEPGLSEVTVSLYDPQGNAVPHVRRLEPDDYDDGEIVNDARPDVTLAAVGSGVGEPSVHVQTNTAATGTKVFAHRLPGGASNTTWRETRQLRMDFHSSVQTVSLDVFSPWNNGVGKLSAYAKDGTLLGECVTALLNQGDIATMSVTRLQPDIAYAIAGGEAGRSSVRFDNLQFGVDWIEVTKRSGAYSFEGIAPGSYRILATPAGGAVITFPTTGVQTIAWDGSDPVTDANFGLSLPALSVSLNRTQVLENDGNGVLTATIRRNPASGTANPLSVTLASSDETELRLPTSVTIPAGQWEATAPVQIQDDSLLDGTQSVTITAASSGHVADGQTVAVHDAETLAVAIAAASVPENAGAGATTGTVTRSNTDNIVALVVTLSSSDATEATVPATVTIPAGQASATFNVAAVDDALLDGTQAVTITAAGTGYVSVADTVDITDLETLTVTIAAAAVTENAGTGATTGTVTRSNTDNGSALLVTLTSSDTTEAAVPATLTISAGQASATFSVAAVDDTLLDGTQTVTVTAASTGYVSVGDTVAVTDVEALTVTIVAAAVPENAGAGATTGTVTRSNTDVGQPLVVTLSSTDTSEATVPVSVTILANQSSATFTITAVDDNLRDGTQPVAITASAAGYVSGSRPLDVTDYETVTVTTNATSINENGGAATGTATRSNTDIGQPLVVTLASSDTTEATVPATVTIPANQASATFAITAVDDALLDGTQTVTITASAAGYVSGTKTVDVTDYETLTVTVNPASISENGGTATGTVTRSNTDTGQALTVTLVSSDTTEAVPTSVTILANQSSATFAITAVDDTLLDGTQTVTITASAAGYVSGTKTLDVTDYETLAVTINPASISENGGSATGTVTRGNTDAGQALTVSLASSDTTEAAVPASVTIPANQASATFAIAAVDDALLDGTQTVTVTASATGYIIGDATLDVTDFNHLPTISDIADQTSEEDTPKGPVVFTVGDAETASGSLTVTARSDNQTLLPDANLALGGSGANRTLTLTPAANQLGTATITVLVSDGAASASDTFVLTVTAVNDPPARLEGTLTPISVAEDSANTTDVTLGLNVVTYGPGGGADELDQTLTYKVTTVPSFITVWNGGALVTTDTMVSLTELRGLTYRTVADANGTASLSWTVTDDGVPAQTLTENLAIAVTAVNDPPVFTSSAAPSVAENTTAVVSLAATDADVPAQTVTFSITDGADQGKFEIVAGQLRFKTAPDYELPTDADTNNIYLVQVTADDGSGGTTVQNVSVTVTPVNDNSPVFTSSGAPSVAENTTAVVTLAATDADLPAQSVGFTITGGADQGKLEIVAGQLRFKAAPDYELPTDVGANNVYEVSVTADDGAGGTTVQEVNVTVLLTSWQNPRHPCDVDDDRYIKPLDVLVLINDINAHGSRKLTALLTPTPPPFLDPTGNDEIAPIDVLTVINYINAHGSGPIPSASGGEGEYDSPIDRDAEAIAASPHVVGFASDIGGSLFTSVWPSRGPQAVRPTSLQSASRTASTVTRARAVADTLFDRELETSELEDAILAIADEVAQAWDVPRPA